MTKTKLSTTMAGDTEQSVLGTGRRRVNHIGRDIKSLFKFDGLIKFFCSSSATVRIVVDTEPFQVKSQDGRCLVNFEALRGIGFTFAPF